MAPSSYHVHNTLTKLSPDDTRTAIAAPDQLMAGCTACALHPGDPTGLYVTTTGGVIQPYQGVVAPAKLVRLETGKKGEPLKNFFF